MIVAPHYHNNFHSEAHTTSTKNNKKHQSSKHRHNNNTHPTKMSKAAVKSRSWSGDMTSISSQDPGFFDIHRKSASMPALDRPVPLENSWCFWFDKYPGPNLTPTQYQDALLSLGDFSTIQGFWSYYNHLPNASDIQVSCSYHMMKSGILPLWEDSHNIDGGHLAFKVSQDDVDLIWRQLTLSVIGEQYHEVIESPDEICGASVSVRPKNEAVVSIWNKDAKLFDTDSICSLISSVVPEIQLDNPSYRVHHHA
jgi:hypothetical protein